MKKIPTGILIALAVLAAATLAAALFENGLDSRDEISLFAVFISFSSLFFSVYLSGISRATSRAETFRQMRFAFFEFRQKLPSDWLTRKDLPSGPGAEAYFAHMIRYWQYSFDEWFVTTELNPRVMRPLWDKYYKTAITKTACSAPMLTALFAAFNTSGNDTDKKFLKEVFDNLSTEEAKREAVRLALDARIALPEGFGLEKLAEDTVSKS